MLIKEHSPLRTLPSGLAPSQEVVLDGVRYSMEMVDIAYARLRETLLSISTQLGVQGGVASAPVGLFASALLDAWAIIDSANRLRILLAYLPGVKPGMKRTAEWKLVERQLAPVLELRNAVQHLTGEVENLVAQSLPTWGALRWFYFPTQDTFTYSTFNLTPGGIRAGMGRSVVVKLDGTFHWPVGAVELEAHGQVLSLSSVWDDTARFCPRLEALLIAKFPRPGTTARDIVTSLGIHRTLTENLDVDPPPA
jgi:hypothetical protein